MESNNLYKKTEQFVTGLFNDNKNANLVFHNLEHTRDVVERTKEIAGHYYLSENDMLAVYIAAWFHKILHQFNTFFFMMCCIGKQVAGIMKPGSYINRQHIIFAQVIMAGNFFGSFNNVLGMLQVVKYKIGIFMIIK